MGLGQDQHLHPAVHSGGVSRGRVRVCGCFHYPLLSAHVKRFSVPHMQDFLEHLNDFLLNSKSFGLWVFRNQPTTHSGGVSRLRVRGCWC